jgi:predicted membrane-bound spermidine synthase
MGHPTREGGMIKTAKSKPMVGLADYLSKVFSFRRYIIANTILFALFSVACAFIAVATPLAKSLVA